MLRVFIFIFMLVILALNLFYPKPLCCLTVQARRQWWESTAQQIHLILFGCERHWEEECEKLWCVLQSKARGGL